jgi:hypothetical protein
MTPSEISDLMDAGDRLDGYRLELHRLRRERDDLERRLDTALAQDAVCIWCGERVGVKGEGEESLRAKAREHQRGCGKAPVGELAAEVARLRGEKARANECLFQMQEAAKEATEKFVEANGRATALAWELASAKSALEAACREVVAAKRGGAA